MGDLPDAAGGAQMMELDETFSLVLRQRNIARDGLNYAVAQRDLANQFAVSVLCAWMADLKERHTLEREVLRLQKKRDAAQG